MIAHMSYVACDYCGAPASDVCADAKEAREMVPRSWQRAWDTRRGRRVDWCGACRIPEPHDSEHG